MKILVFSDIHGLSSGSILMEKAIEKYCPDRILLLGDLTDGGEGDSVYVIRKYSGFITAVEGNCDSKYRDEDILGIRLPPSTSLMYENHQVYMSHAYPYVKFSQGSIVLYGHSHVKDLHFEDGVLYLNPGSISLPRDGKASFALMLDNKVQLLDASTYSVIKEELI